MSTEASSSSADESLAVLKARAHTLAQPETDADKGAAALHVLEFRLGEERYAVDTAFVREVHPLKNITPVPCTPPFILGIINVRGQIVAVMDAKKFFNVPARAVTDTGKVLILQGPDIVVGILADEVIGGRQVPLHEMQSSLPVSAGGSDAYLRGVTGDRLVVLDAEHILTDRRIIVDEVVE